jgi:type IV pilus assembly protein PilE
MMQNRQLSRQLGRLRGFTLVELMIVVTIVAILGAIAFPSYRQHVMKTKRAECEGVMTTAAAMFERHYAANATYALDSSSSSLSSLTCPQDGGTTSYVLDGWDTATSSTFMITATPQGGQLADACGTLTLNEIGEKGSDKTVAECWR